MNFSNVVTAVVFLTSYILLARFFLSLFVSIPVPDQPKNAKEFFFAFGCIVWPVGVPLILSYIALTVVFRIVVCIDKSITGIGNKIRESLL